jgi:hypothetical protein|tara:strand:- start:454 stop:660 length:207 start_codon:yes stop_codon:yes gene_type:complete
MVRIVVEFICFILIIPILIPLIIAWVALELSSYMVLTIGSVLENMGLAISSFLYILRDLWDKKFPTDL